MDVAGSSVEDNDMEVSLFDDVIRLYQMLLENMLDGIKSYVFDDVKARSRPYRTEKYVEQVGLQCRDGQAQLPVCSIIFVCL